MKTLLSAIAFSLFLHSIVAQNCTTYIPSKEGASWETTNYDKKNKEISKASSTIKKITQDAQAVVYDIHVMSTATKGDISEADYTIKCENNTFSINLKSMAFNYSEAFKGMKIDIIAQDMEYPSPLTVGATLKDATLTINPILETPMPINMSTVITIKNKKIVAQEDITTPAGTFNCYKITYEVSTKASMINTTVKACEWISVGNGTVRSETYNNKGEIDSYSLLTAIKK